jgi:hypothetical protein
MQDFANEVNSIGYEYRPVSQNSNSFAGGALQRAGFSGLPHSSDKSDGGNWFTRLAGTSSRTPQKPAQSPLDDLLREIYGDSTMPPWLFQRQS